MPEHDRFEELCALAAIGQLSDEELRELADHLKTCYSCRRTAGEFAFLLNHLPVEEADTDDYKNAGLLSKSHRERFLARARAEGVQFSPQAELVPRISWWPKLKPVARIAVPALAALAAIAVLLPMWWGTASSSLRIEFVPPRVAQLAPQTVAPRPPAETPDKRHQSEDEALRGELAQAKAEAFAARTDAGTSKARAADADQQLRAARTELAHVTAETEKLRASHDAATAELVAQQYRLNALTDEISKQREAAEQERQLTHVARDVRELMGARNLHILDVFDSDGRGRSRKSFGRVFYVEGKSLIFYAFDLKQKGAGNTKVSFQAWGQRSTRSEKPKNLGIFSLDDHAQARWVLKVEDPAKLALIDSVFVTVEPLGGADRPTGQKLLYAFLGSQANHP